MFSSGSSSSGAVGIEPDVHRGQSKFKTVGLGLMGFSKKKGSESVKLNNMGRIRTLSSRTIPEGFHYNPKVSQSFLENWLDFPVDANFSVIINSFRMWFIWLIWTNKGMAGLDPSDTTVRARICSQLSVLGTAAGLMLVIAVAGLLVPPTPHREEDKIWLDVFGVLMLTAAVSLTFYIGVALTCFYPLIESLRDDVAFDAFENYQNRIGGYEVYLFFVGMLLVLIALLVAAKMIYSYIAVYTMLGVTFIICMAVTYISRHMFLALDPISAMHMGLSNDPQEQYRAELMSHYILRKVPNTLIDCDTVKEVFHQKKESMKYEKTKREKFEEPRPSQHMRDTVGFSPRADEVEAFADQELPDRVPLAMRDSDRDPPLDKVQRELASHASSLLWRDAKVVPVASNEIEDLEVTSSVPFADKLKVSAAEVAQPGHHGEGVTSPMAPSFTRQSTSQTAFVPPHLSLPSLQDMFCHPDSYRFRTVGLSLEDSTAAYECLVRSGCTSIEELVAYLDDHKQYRPCSCGAATAPLTGGYITTPTNASSKARPPPPIQHAPSCSCRQAGAWTAALTVTGIPVFHARKIVLNIKSFLA